jgi:signal peptidase I
MKVSNEARGYLLLLIFFVALVGGFTVITRAWSGTNLPIAAVESGSMEPTIPTGSLIFIQKVTGADLVAGPKPVGDVVVFYWSNTKITDYWIRTIYDPAPWSHRAIAKQEINGTYYVLTKGDANLNADENPNDVSTWIPMRNVIGRVVWFIPYVGYLFLWSNSPFVVVAILIILLIIIIIPMSTGKKDTKTDDEKAIITKNLYKAP